MSISALAKEVHRSNSLISRSPIKNLWKIIKHNVSEETNDDSFILQAAGEIEKNLIWTMWQISHGYKSYGLYLSY